MAQGLSWRLELNLVHGLRGGKYDNILHRVPRRFVLAFFFWRYISQFLNSSNAGSQNLLVSTRNISVSSDNHVCMVHRMIGNKSGTGGSSGYQYLRSTVRYCVQSRKLKISTSSAPQLIAPRLSKLTCHVRPPLPDTRRPNFGGRKSFFIRRPFNF